MLLTLAVVHIVFYGIGYLATSITFSDSYYYSSIVSELGLIYFVSVLVGILLLIGWLVFYSRNNGFRTFYPRKSYQVYLEWIMIFIITAGIASIPYTLTEGSAARWRSVASFKEAIHAIETLNKAKVLIPNDFDNYRYNSRYHKPIPIPDSMLLSADTIDLNLFATEYSYNNGIHIKGYTGPSLLFSDSDSGYDPYYYMRRYEDSESFKRKLRIEQEQVKDWLREGRQDSILAVMQDFHALQLKQGFKINITPEQWLRRIYHPPFFPVNPSTAINRYQYNDGYDHAEVAIVQDVTTAPVIADDDNYINPFTIPYLQYGELTSGYTQVLRYYSSYNEDAGVVMIICICFALLISVFVFSFRVTGGKPWLIAFVATGILIFAIILLGVGLFESVGYRSEEIILILLILFWVALFIALVARIINKIMEKSNKGRSPIYMNILIWLVPFLMPLLFLTVTLHADYVDEKYFNPQEEDVMMMFKLNIIFSAVVMWFISVLVRRWKSIADE